MMAPSDLRFMVSRSGDSLNFSSMTAKSVLEDFFLSL